MPLYSHPGYPFDLVHEPLISRQLSTLNRLAN